MEQNARHDVISHWGRADCHLNIAPNIRHISALLFLTPTRTRAASFSSSISSRNFELLRISAAGHTDMTYNIHMYNIHDVCTTYMCTTWCTHTHTCYMCSVSVTGTVVNIEDWRKRQDRKFITITILHFTNCTITIVTCITGYSTCYNWLFYFHFHCVWVLENSH